MTHVQIFTQSKKTDAVFYAEWIFLHHFAGVCPVMAAKVREKTDDEEKPHSAAISAIFRSGCSIFRRLASSMRYRLTN